MRGVSAADTFVLRSGQGRVGRGSTEINAAVLNELEERRAVAERAVFRGLSICREEAEGEHGESKKDGELHFGLGASFLLFSWW